MGMKRRYRTNKPEMPKQNEDAYEYPPFGEKEFWDWHRRAAEKNAKKRQIGEDVREFISVMVEKYSDDDIDPRRDIAWYLEQLGNSLREEVDREESARRRAEAARARAEAADTDSTSEEDRTP